MLIFLKKNLYKYIFPRSTHNWDRLSYPYGRREGMQGE